MQGCDPTCVATPVSSRKLLGVTSPWDSLTERLYQKWQVLVSPGGQGRRRLVDRPCCTTSSIQVGSILDLSCFCLMKMMGEWQEPLLSRTMYCHQQRSSHESLSQWLWVLQGVSAPPPPPPKAAAAGKGRSSGIVIGIAVAVGLAVLGQWSFFTLTDCNACC